ncbi:DUF488 domain-containing protein [Mesorhizobium sp. CO1-1-7]|uniref:DUF488 domain-containing protein n=1 Tax=Mesorhizobium sp. CO1-1-7 TaxID=2876632 RepID=UPI001CD0F0DB|nr:DUF488 domain-containing protein [Mesorhizobium sp. CO1-1-7]MBZ9746747.1 DUF488 domain-containing protein [Mesorhizobium sp. CO1-1-7]
MTMHSIHVSTIGFTKSTAERFFERLLNANVKKLIDVRLNNTSQLAGFAKAEDLAYFLRKIGGIQYVHQPMFAPTADILDAYKKEKGDWSVYERQFTQLLEGRKIEERLRPDMFDGTCLLCSEATPHHCHRRLVCEYLNSKWGSPLKVLHL